MTLRQLAAPQNQLPVGGETGEFQMALADRIMLRTLDHSLTAAGVKFGMDAFKLASTNPSGARFASAAGGFATYYQVQMHVWRGFYAEQRGDTAEALDATVDAAAASVGFLSLASSNPYVALGSLTFTTSYSVSDAYIAPWLAPMIVDHLRGPVEAYIMEHGVSEAEAWKAIEAENTRQVVKCRASGGIVMGGC